MTQTHLAATATATAPYLALVQVGKTFGSFTALKGIDLTIARGEFVCLLGPSGCGKTTLLRLIAGLETISQGHIWQNGSEVTYLPPSHRDFGIVFQSYALFPNLTAADNVGYGLVNTGMAKAERQRRVAELLAMVGLAGSEPNYPAQLSGGQQQRVALARALALSPGLLLLDEPLSALDAQVRTSLRSEIVQLQKRLGVTTVMVTHDQIEALTMADRVVVMDKGVIAQVGTPLEIYRNPATPFVAQFIGSMNMLCGEVIDQSAVRCGTIVLQVRHRLPKGQPVLVAIRPEDVRLGSPSLTNSLAVTVQFEEFLGAVYRLHTTTADQQRLWVDVAADQRWSGDIWLQLPLDRLHCFAA